MSLADDLHDDLTGWGPLYAAASAKYHIPVQVLRALVMKESSGNPEAVGKPTKYGTAVGGAQILPGTAKALGVTDRTDPEQFIPAAAKYLREGIDAKGSLEGGLKYYHGGPNEKIWGPKTDAYAKEVLANSGNPQVPTTQSFNLSQSLRKDLALGTEGPSGAAAPQPAHAQDLWGPVSNFANNIFFGHGMPIKAGTAAVKEAIQEISHGVPLQQAIGGIPEHYRQAEAAYGASQKAFAKENPTENVVTGVLGNMTGAIPLVMSGNAALGAVGRAAPALEGPANFLAGTGRAGEGFVPFAGRRLAQVTSGTLQGGLLGALDNNVDSGKGAAQGALIGGVLGGLTSPVVAGAAEPFVSSALRPVAEVAEKARALGVDLPGWAISTNKTVQGVGRQLDKKLPQRLEDFNSAVAKAVGAKDLTPEGINAALDLGSKKFQTAVKGKAIGLDLPLWQDLGSIDKVIVQKLADPTQIRTAQNVLENIKNTALSGNITGDEYLNLTNSKSALAKLYKIDPEVAQTMKDALDNAWDRQVPGVTGAINEARSNWRGLMTVKPLAEKNPSGMISPQSLLPAVVKKYGSTENPLAGDLGTLAQAGRFLPSVGPEGTAKVVGNVLEHGTVPALGMGLLAGEGLPILSEGLHEPQMFIPAAMAAGGAYAAKKGLQSYMSSPSFAQGIIDRTLSGYRPPIVNPLIPPAEYLYGNEDQGQ